MDGLKFRDLRADEIDARVGQVSKSGTGFSLLLYKDARVDMDILDETVGSFNWKREHCELKGNIYCGLSIWDKEKQQWITKWDCGAESNTEKEKGESSDSFKRASVCFGIGRKLYSSPFIWVKGDPKSYNGFRVSKITYDDKGIVDLTIEAKIDNEWKKVFSTQNVSKTPLTREGISNYILDNVDAVLLEELNRYGMGGEDNLKSIANHFGVQKITNKEIKETIALYKKKNNL